jgi:hypothetical protein
MVALTILLGCWFARGWLYGLLVELGKNTLYAAHSIGFLMLLWLVWLVVSSVGSNVWEKMPGWAHWTAIGLFVGVPLLAILFGLAYAAFDLLRALVGAVF